MNINFAPSEKDTLSDVKKQLINVNSTPILNSLVESVGGLLAILNEKRQVLTLNDNFLKKLGIDNPEEVLGLRPGRVLNCIYTNDGQVECGTSKYCSNCGAAIAIVSSLKKNKPAERKCFISANKDGENYDIAFIVKAHPIEIEENKYIILFLQDITYEQERAILERTFFHDINNILSGLVGATELLYENDKDSTMNKLILKSVHRLQCEMDLQRTLLSSNSFSYKPEWDYIKTSAIFKETYFFFANHPLKKNKFIEFKEDEDIYVKTDASILQRILCNMISNALEATIENGEIFVWYETDDFGTTFFVKNDAYISEKNQLRIFQRNFSTKDGEGRGIGTYSIKFLGEKILKGKVKFVSSKNKGTIFSFRILD